MIRDGSKESVAVEREMKILEFEERRNDKRLVYWIEFAAKFGFTHMHAPAYKLGKIKQNDYDIVAMLIGAIMFTLYTTSYLFQKIIKGKEK